MGSRPTNLYEIADGKLRLNLHYGQTQAWDSTARFTFVLAGSQGGKTSFGPWWIWKEAKAHDLEGDYLAVTASYDLFKLKMLPEMRTVFEDILRIGRYWSGERIIELAHPEKGFLAKRADDPMHGRIVLRSAQSPGGLESATVRAAWLDECGQDDFRLESWEAIQRRLTLHRGNVLGTTTIYNLGWLKGEVYDRWVAGDSDYAIIQFSSILNPAFPPEELERMRRVLPDWKFKMFYLGEFAKPEGLIYSCFEDNMLEDAFVPPLDWPRVVGIDFGGANQAAVYLARDPKGVWHLYDETLEGEQTTKEHARRMRVKLDGCEDVTFVGGAKGESQQRRDWRAAKIPIKTPPINDVEAGIERVVRIIKENRFRLSRECKGVKDEIGTYRRKLDDEGEPTEQIVDKSAFHRLDALRYAACQITSARHFMYGFV